MAKQYYSLDEVVGSDDNLLTLDQVFGTPQERMQQAKARQQEVMRGLPQTFDAPLSPEQQKRLDGDVKHLIDAGVGIGEAETMARAAYRAPGGEGVLQSFKKMVSPDENPIGFWEAFVEDPDKFVPVWGTLKGIGELASVLEAAKRLEADAYDTPAEERPYAGPFGGPYAVPGYTPPSNRTTFTKEQDQKTVNQWMEAEAERSKRGYSFGGRAGMIMGEMPAFIGDILLTKGLYTGSKAAVHTLLRTAGKEVVERQAKKALIAGGFKRLAAWAVASGIRSGAGTPHRVLETYLQNRLPENVKTDDDGNITFSWPKEAPVTTLLKAWGDIAIEMASEEAGETLTKGAGAIAKSLTKTRFGGKVLPKLYEAYRKIHPDTEWAEFVRRASTMAGFHGILGEMGEEYLGDQMRAVTGVDDFGAGPKAGMLQRMEAAFIQDIKMTPEMAASFAPLAGGVALAERIRGRGARGESVTPTEPTAPGVQPPLMSEEEMIEAFSGDTIRLEDLQQIVELAAVDRRTKAALETLFGKKVEVPDETQATPQETPRVRAEGEAAGVAPTVAEAAPVEKETRKKTGQPPTGEPIVSPVTEDKGVGREQPSPTPQRPGETLPAGAAAKVSLANRNAAAYQIGSADAYLTPHGTVLIDGTEYAVGESAWLFHSRFYPKPPKILVDETREQLRSYIENVVQESRHIDRSKTDPSERYANLQGNDANRQRMGELIDSVTLKHDPTAIEEHLIQQALDDKRFEVGHYLHVAGPLTDMQRQAVEAYQAAGGQLGRTAIDAMEGEQEAQRVQEQIYGLEGHAIEIEPATPSSDVTSRVNAWYRTRVADLKQRNRWNPPSESSDIETAIRRKGTVQSARDLSDTLREISYEMDGGQRYAYIRTTMSGEAVLQESIITEHSLPIEHVEATLDRLAMEENRISITAYVARTGKDWPGSVHPENQDWAPSPNDIQAARSFEPPAGQPSPGEQTSSEKAPVRPQEPRETEPDATVGREGGPQAGGQAEAGAKQPFEMTREEFRQWAAENHPHPQIRKSAKSKRSMEPGTTQAVDLATVRDNEVLQAFNRGEAIPPEVLKDYPDLQKRAKDERELRDQTAKEDAWKEILVGKLREQHVADLTDAEIERAFAGTGARNKNTEMAKKFVREGKITLADVLRPIFVVDSDGKIGRVVRWTDEGYPVVVYPGKTGGVQPGTAPTGVAGQPYEYELGPDVRPATEVDFNKQIRPGGSETQIDLRRWKDQFLQEQQQRSKPGVTTLPTEPAAKKAKWVEIADELTASIQENGLSDRGGDYWSARLKELSDADLKRFYDWTQLQGAKNPYIQRFAGGNASAEMRRRHGLESEPAPAEKPEAPPTAEKTPAQILAEHGLKVEKRISKAGNPWWAVTGNTGEPGIKAVLDRLVPKDRGGKPQKPAKIYDESVGRKVWTRSFYDGDPTEKIARELQGLPAATEPRGTGETGTQEPVDTEARASDLESERKRSAENERPIRDRIDRDIEGYVSPETSRLISLGLKHNIPQDIVNEQIEDVALGVRAFEEQGRLFLLANEAGTGKTYVLGGLIRELKARGVKKILYVTLNEDLVNQIQGDLADYGLEGVEFVTYAGIRKGGHRINGGVVIFDEAHSTKNVTSQQGKSAQDLMKQARFTILSSATPFENPVEAAYLDATGVFDRVGGHHEWAKMYGADVITTKYFDYAAGQEVTKERLVWNGGKHKVKDQIEARNWFKRQGAFTQRAKRLPKGSVTTTFRKQAASDQYVEMVETVLAAYAQADVEANSSREFNNPSNHAMIKMHEVNTLKRILEAAKVQAGIERARELIAEGKQVVIFTETKADLSIGRFRTTGGKGKEYTYPEMQRIWREYQDRLNVYYAQPGGGRGSRPKAPFSEAIMLIAEAMHDAGIDYTLPGVSDALREAFPDAALYTGEVTAAQAKKNLKAWKDGKVKVLIATMAKGGTGLSLHDTTGTKPDRVQVGINLPWTATQIDQTSGRLARYGIHPDHPVGIEWLFADNIDFERTLARKVGGRMQDMGALVRGLEIEAADALQDFDFEDAFDAGRVTVHEAAVQPRKTTKLTDERIAAVGAAEQYRQAEALERSRPKSSGEFDFFETPYPLSVFMTRVSEVKKGDKVLEPSAGQGSLLRFLPDGVDVDALEVNRQHAHKLSQMGPKVVSTQIDFLIWTPYRGEYDVILMNPPFSRKAGVGWQDAAHVMKAYEHLKDGGRLVAVMGEGSFFRSDKQSSAFRDWLDEVGAQVVKMPEEVFKRSGTKVNVRLVVIDKGAEPGRTDIDLPEATTDRYLELEGYITPRAEQATAEPTPERQEAVEQAQEEAETATEEALSPEAEQQPSRTVERKAIEPTAKGAETQVEVPGGKPIKARYAVLQLRSLKPSHDAHTGTPSPNETYPKGLQPRDYREGSEEFLKIVGFATEKKAGYYVNTHPGADSGPPTVTPDGTVINGNGRVMSLQYAYTVLGDYDWYRNALNDARQQFGLEYASGGAIELGETPVLVRIVEMDPDSVEAKKFARAGNVTTTQAQSPLRTAASLADLVNVDVLDTLQLDENTTFSDAVKSTKGRQFRQALAESLPDAERARFINEMGDLTDAGTELARNMLMLKIFPVEVLEKLSDERKGLKQSLEGAIPQLLKAKRDYPEIDIAGPLVEAVEFLGRNPDVQDMAGVNDTVNQGALFGGGSFDSLSPEGRILVSFFFAKTNSGGKVMNSPSVFRTRLKNLMVDLSGGTGLFAQTQDIGALIADDLGVPMVKGAKFEAKAKPSPKPAEEATPLQTAIAQRDFDTLKRMLAPGQDANRQRFEEITQIVLPDTEAGTENVIGEFVRGDADRYRRQSGRTSIIPDAAAELAAISRRLVGGPASLVGNAVAMFRRNVVSVNRYLRTMGGAGRLIAHDFDVITHAVTKQANNDKADLRRIFRGMSRNQLERAAMVLNGRLDAKTQPRKIVEAAEAMRKVLDRSMNEANALGMTRNVRGKRIPIGGSGKAFPQIPNQKGMDFLHEAKTKAKGSARVFAWAQEQVKAGRFKDIDEAIIALQKFRDAQLRAVNPYFESTRVELPVDMIEWNPVKVLPHLIDRNWMTIEGVRQWGTEKGGQSFPLLRSRIERIRRDYGSDHAQRIENYVQVAFGDRSIVHKNAEAISRTVRGFQFISKVGISPLTIMRNMADRIPKGMAISPLATIRASIEYPPFVNGFIRASQKLEDRMVRAGAVFGHGSLSEGYEAGSFFSELLASPFAESERGNQVFIATVAYHKLLHDIAILEQRGADVSNRLVERVAAVFGQSRAQAAFRVGPEIEATILAGQPVSQEQIDAFLADAVSRNAFPMLLNTKPVWYETHPGMRVLAQFKTWPIRQTNLIWNDVLKYTVKTGDPTRLIGFLIGTLIAGEIYNILRDWLFGKDESLLSQMRKDPEGRRIGMAIFNDLIDGGGVGMIADFTYGLVDWTAGVTLRTAKNVSDAARNIRNAPALAPQALEQLAEREISPYRQIKVAIQKLDARADQGNISRQYNQTRAAAWLYKEGKENPTAADKAMAWTDDAIWGRPDYGIGENTLAYELASRQIIAGDIDDAAKYLSYILSRADDRKKALTGIKQSMARRSPMGPVAERDRAAFLRSLPDDERHRAVATQRMYLRHYQEALRRAIRSAR